MPFPDELPVPSPIPYRAEWPTDFGLLRDHLQGALGSLAIAIDHVGSTAIPGLASKDCVDVQVRVRSAQDFPAVELCLERQGFRRRTELWNQAETADGESYRKLVFAPPIGARRSNIHVRVDRTPPARRNLLFRDYLVANPKARDAWGAFKLALSRQAPPDTAAYGDIKWPAWEVLMAGAEAWRAQAEPRHQRATVHLAHGYLCAGKTRFAKQLAAETGAIRLAIDDWTIAASGDREHLDPDLYARVRDLLTEHWIALVRQGIDVVLDFGFWSRQKRDSARTSAVDVGAVHQMYSVTCPEAVARARCSERNRTSSADYYFAEGAYDALKSKYEPLDPDEERIEISGL